MTHAVVFPPRDKVGWFYFSHCGQRLPHNDASHTGRREDITCPSCRDAVFVQFRSVMTTVD